MCTCVYESNISERQKWIVVSGREMDRIISSSQGCLISASDN